MSFSLKNNKNATFNLNNKCRTLHNFKKEIKESQQGNFEEETTFLLKAAIVKLESERIDLEEKVDSMKEAEEKMTQ